MPHTVEKVRIAEGDVLRSGGNLLANIFQHDLAVHHAEYTVVDRNNRAVAAKMLASPARFRVAGNAVFAGGENHVGILREHWKSVPVGPDEFLPRQGDYRLGLRLDCRFIVFAVLLETLREMRKPFLEFTSKNMFHSLGAEMRLIHGRVEAIEAHTRSGIQAANRFDELNGQPRGRVHGHVESDKLGEANGVLMEWLPRQIKRRDPVAPSAQPRRRRRQPKGLPAQLISRYQDNIHGSTSIAARRSDAISVIIEGCLAG